MKEFVYFSNFNFQKKNILNDNKHWEKWKLTTETYESPQNF